MNYLRRVGVVILVLGGLGGLGGMAWLERVPLLRGAANLWIVSDEATHADAVVVLGGGLEERPFIAADLYHNGLAKTVLISQVAEGHAVEVGIVQGHTEANYQALLKLGVPAAAIETFGVANKNMNDEAVELRAWVDTHKVTAIIIPIEIFSSRRVYWIFHHKFFGLPTHIEVLAFDQSNFTRENWWRDDRGLIAFQNEIIKYIYYRLRH
jgi:uncharacterized SAM-binding protein YcdF (DUF218 family)